MDWKEERSLTSSKISKFRQAYLLSRVYIGTMNRLQAFAVDRMQEFMILHHGEDVTVAQVLALSNYSPFHASRLFTEATGYSVGEYLRKLRLTDSAKRLKDGNVDVTKEAFDSGYESVEGFLRAFRNEFGVSPGEYRKSPVPICHFLPYRVKFRNPELNKREKMKETRKVFIQRVTKPRRKVMIRRGVKGDNYWDYSMEVGCDVWGILKSISPEPVCLFLTEKYRTPGTSRYVQGVELPFDWNGKVIDGFEIIEMPETEYLMFQGEKFQEEYYEEAIKEIQDALEEYDPSVIGCRWSESEPRIQLEPRGERGYIELKAIEKA